jgi:cytochrome c peroxidase
LTKSKGEQTMKTRSTIISSVLAGVCWGAGLVAAADLSPIEELGKKLLFDTHLSTPQGQSCAACHAPEVGFTGPTAAINAGGAVYEGAVHNRFGNRKPPAAAYAGFGPVLHYSEEDGVWEGGTFWDGRATGWTLGDPLAEQAMGPFLNPLEQNNPNAKHVVTKVRLSSYADLFRQVWGTDSLKPGKNVALAYERIARSIAAYERSAEVNPFTAKYDYYLKGQATLTDVEARGLALFEGKAKCSLCHLSQPGADDEPPVFTDYTFDNLGVPKNPDNPFYTMKKKYNPDGKNWIDTGLGGFLKSAGYAPEVYEPEMGKQKVPTLRNVDKRPALGFVKAYGHNGYFKSLAEIVHFYNTRDVAAWPPAEVPETVNTSELGDLGLTAQEEADLVEFLKTLNDGYVLPTP